MFRLSWLLLLFTTLTVSASDLADVELMVQNQPRQAYDISVAQLNASTTSNKDFVYWHVLASESALALTLNREALSHANEGLQNLSAAADSNMRLRLLTAKAQALDLGGDSEEARKIINTVMLELESNKNEQRLLEALIARGTIYTTLVRTTEALVDLRRAYALAPTESNRVERADVAALIGNLYASILQYDDAAYFYQEAMNRHRQTKNLYKLAVETYSLAITKMRVKDFDAALELMRESKTYSEQIDDRQGVAFARYGIAEIAREKGQYKQGYQDYQYAIQWFRQAGDKGSLILALRGLALAKMDSGQNAAAQIDINEAIAIAETQTDKSIIARTHETNAQILAKVGQYQKAYEEHIKFHKMFEALKEEQMSLTTAELRVKFETDRRQQENALLQNENALKEAQLQQQKQRSSTYILSLTLTISIVGFLIYFAYKQKQTRLELSHLAETDMLTGLYNRRRMLELAEVEFERSRRYGVEFCVAILDLDHFKHINDHFGHDCGDKVLKSFAQFCRQTLRQTDVIGRWGGEEFVVILSHTNLSTAVMTLDRLRINLAEQAVLHNAETVKVTVSIGVAQLQGDADFNVLLNRADHALYNAKNAGRNRVKSAAIVREADAQSASQSQEGAAHAFEIL